MASGTNVEFVLQPYVSLRLALGFLIPLFLPGHVFCSGSSSSYQSCLQAAPKGLWWGLAAIWAAH